MGRLTSRYKESSVSCCQGGVTLRCHLSSPRCRPLPPELQEPLQQCHPGGTEAMVCSEKCLYSQCPPKTGQGPCRQHTRSVNLKGPSRHGTHMVTLLLSSPFLGVPTTNRFLHPWGAHGSCPSRPQQPPHRPSLPLIFVPLCSWPQPAGLTVPAARASAEEEDLSQYTSSILAGPSACALNNRIT